MSKEINIWISFFLVSFIQNGAFIFQNFFISYLIYVSILVHAFGCNINCSVKWDYYSF